jgi:hypothetical protein
MGFMRCPKCGKELMAETRFCPECGTSMTGNNSPSLPSKKKPSKMKKGCLGCFGIIIIFFIIIIIGGVMMSGKTTHTSSNTSASSSTKETTKTDTVKKDGITYDKFINIAMGSSYEQVRDLIGKDGTLEQQLSTAGIETKSYVWKDGSANMTCMFQDGALNSKAMASLKNLVHPNGNITLDMFNKINMGMSYDDVKNITGSDGYLLSEVNIAGMDASIYHWINIGGANMAITFNAGSVDSKTQFGLK